MKQPHRPGPFHQVNKAHKGEKARKKSTSSSLSKCSKKIIRKLSKRERLNQAKSKKSQKSQVKQLGHDGNPPILIGLLDTKQGKSFLDHMKDANLDVKIINERVVYVVFEQYKTRFKLIFLDPTNYDECIDLVKTIDLMLLFHDANIENDDNEDYSILLRSIYLHCMPTVVHVLNCISEDFPSRDALMKAKQVVKCKVGDDKVHTLENSKDLKQLFNLISDCKRTQSPFKDSRPIIVPDKAEIVDGKLTFLGFVRKKILSPNSLVHVVNHGDYQIDKIDILPDIVSLTPCSKQGLEIVETLKPDLMHQETLEDLNEVDPMNAEQTWPDEVSSDSESDINSDMEVGSSDTESVGHELYDNNDVGSEDKEDDQYSENGDDVKSEFAARTRYAKYRGLKSFRTSKWDPEENLPIEYSKIFQFKNFQLTKRVATAEKPNIGANPGQYVRIYLANVPREAIQNILEKKVCPTLVGLLRYERKMSVMNFLIKRLPCTECCATIKSKDELIFYVGFRKFKAKPLFTNHSISSRHRYERQLTEDVTMVATMYAPVCFPPAPILVFKPNSICGKDLVAAGSVLDSNPNRLIIKRVRLTGHPFKIHSKSVVVRNMFTNNEDVLYFKPVELVTKQNKRGHITEPLGTHGNMKCRFDRKLRSDDKVFMSLYKRVFPKWTYTPIYEYQSHQIKL